MGEEATTGLVNYKGVEQPFSKGSRLSKIAAMSNGREFDMTVKNENEGEEKLFIIPSFQVAEGENGHPVSGKSVKGNPLTITSASGPNDLLALKTFYRYIAENPSLILGLRIESSDKTQLSRTILVTPDINPYLASYAKKKLNIQSYIDENNEQRDIATIDQMLPANNQSQIEIPLVKGTTTFTFFMGPNINLIQ